MYPKYTIERNKTYRLRLVNTGSFASIRFSVDNHTLTLIEADGTLLAPTEVAGVTIAVAQRYSVLLYANQTSSTNGTYWMRATVQSDMFTYDQPGQNLDIRGVIRYDVSFPAQQRLFSDHSQLL
jgi:FtsP/CotA-like multicopper oxidase with cupredoxin domain